MRAGMRNRKFPWSGLINASEFSPTSADLIREETQAAGCQVRFFACIHAYSDNTLPR